MPALAFASTDPTAAATDQILSAYNAGDTSNVVIGPLTPNPTDPSTVAAGPPTVPDSSAVDAVLAPPTADNGSPTASAPDASSTADNSTADAGGAVATVVPQATDSLSPSDAQARKLQSILSSLG
jgi:hypothetical protein